MKWWNVIVLVFAVVLCGSCAAGTVSERDDVPAALDDLPDVENQSVLETLQESLKYHEDELGSCVEKVGLDHREFSGEEAQYGLILDDNHNAAELLVIDSTFDELELETCVADYLEEIWGVDQAKEAAWKTEFSIRFWSGFQRDLSATYHRLDDEQGEKETSDEKDSKHCDTEEIQETIWSNARSIERCFMDTWATAAEQKNFAEFWRSGIGVVITFRIEPGGSVSRVQIPDITLSAFPSDYKKCLGDTFAEIGFSERDGGRCEVTHPLIFQMRGVATGEVGIDLFL